MSTYEISKSALLNLKAEILRKEDDLVKAKSENVQKLKVIKKRAPLELKNKGVEERKQFDYTEEELDLLKLSRSKLETKAKLYEQLSSNGSSTEILNRKYLVRFDKKGIDCSIPKELTDVENLEKEVSDHYDDEVDSSEEWVEYVDCLGRSRKCLRKDLNYFKSKDEDLKSVVEKRQNADSVVETIEDNVETEKASSEKDIENSNEPELMSADIRRDILRQKWEEEEEELRDRSDVHYQNVLFDEARQHGVGYYAFSKDEEERLKQQQALKNLRQETEQKQQKAKELRLLRDKQMAARIRAAKNRRRARLGLPPEEDNSNEIEDEKDMTTDDEERKRVEEEKKKEEEEKQQMEKRKRHLRPWDIGKEGLKEHYIMSQNEWNEKKRDERCSEFAPPTSYQLSKLRHSSKDNHYQKNSDDDDDDDDSDELMRDYRKSKAESINPYKYSQEKTDLNHITSNKKFKSTVDDYHISDTVEAGLKFLRSQVENDKK
ncbi:coiled-coil domain-containing protein 174 [Rhynchophorus ferrugineus]|uniref:CCDC174 alpha/beta GRSR domain-containing protein n=1 Tax=Rhynchophorus ferrugineus TaxID=354439 RepID=A0A834M107_RHYFE|nr:hypothetical protein GWI33_019808 [Rhynchophorus ferrugineus]